MLGLQRLFYGPLRPIEIEQLYEKAWFAITETCLAMTIFREEVGGWFLVMFVCLLIGKVWGWIGEGRVEILEQQPPSNPRLFHARLSVSLLLSILFDIFMLRYSINTVLRHARPNMMVMFAFEFAVLTVASISTAARYTISLHEMNVVKSQIQDRRAQLRREREQARLQPAVAGNTPPSNSLAGGTVDDDVDSLDIDVPGWEEKGRWVFYLDLTTGKSPQALQSVKSADSWILDFFKLILYLTFFCVLCMFYGMPIHIIRDVVLTIRSFYKRIIDFVRYRQATRDMNARYPDATADEVTREDVCIICREDMRPWQQQPNQAQPGVADTASTTALDERLRPKKLPCGHILHFACLRSWLERQQNCPTCRRPVLVARAITRTPGQATADQHVREHGQHRHPQARDAFLENGQQPIVGQNVFNLGPLRIAFGARRAVPGTLPQANNNPTPNEQGPVPTATQVPRMTSPLDIQRQAPGLQNRTFANFSPNNLQLQLHQIEQHLTREISGLRIQQSQLNLVLALQGELARLRSVQANPELLSSWPSATANQSRSAELSPSNGQVGQSFNSSPQQQPLGYGHPSLPAGMTLPVGWTVLPLQRLPDQASASSLSSSNQGISNAAPPAQGVDPSATSLPVDPISRTTSQHTSTAAHESSSVQPRNHSHQAVNQPFVSSVEGRSSPPRTVHAFPRDKDSQPGSEPSAADVGPQRLTPKPVSNSRSSEANQQDFQVHEGSESPATLKEDGAASESDAISEPSGHKQDLKGKGKASTVEDSTEDTD